MVVVGAWRRNDSRIGGLQDRIISNLDNEVLVATVTSPTAISKSIHGSFLKDFRRVSLKLNRIAYYNVSQFVNAQGFPAIAQLPQPGHIRFRRKEGICLTDGNETWQSLK
jgi:hypothetical protein